MTVVALVEKALREHLQPTKINLAALGNVVPHLHWHVIARFDWDTHFPAPVWAQASRAADGMRQQFVRNQLDQVEQEVVKRLTVLGKIAVG
jgi:diadenosine tetraphosphate (Ap4A) HIT family hydrolase